MTAKFKIASEESKTDAGSPGNVSGHVPQVSSDRLKKTLREQDVRGEKAIAVSQAGISCFILLLHLIAQLQTGWQINKFGVIAALAALFSSSVLRHALVAGGKIRERQLDILTAVDITIFLGLIWSYQFAYDLPACSILKAPSFFLLPVLIALRALRFHPRPIIVAGTTAIVGLAALVMLCLYMDGTDAVTRSYPEYLVSLKILIGAEIERIVAFVVLTGILAMATHEARGILSTAAHAEDYSDALGAARLNLADAEQAREQANEALSELRARDEQLTQQNERFNAALKNMNQGLCLFDADQRLIVCNDKYASMYNLTIEQTKPGTLLQDIIEQRIRNGIYAGDNPDDYAKERQDWVTSGVHSTKIQELSDGRAIAINHQPMSGGGWLTTHEDVTERRRAEKEIQDHRDELQKLVDAATRELQDRASEMERALAKEKELNDLQREFVSMASHELRTPLAVIDSSAQRLKRAAERGGLTSQTASARVEKIRSAVRRMTGLMERTLLSARLEDGRLEVDLQQCDIAGLVADVCARQQEITETHRLSCTCEDLPEAIRADPGSVEQMLTNLLTNAVKYSPDNPDISVTARTEGEHVAISVCDHGVGIDKDELGKLGRRFFRARTSAGIAGTGIGLNLINKLAAMHGGGLSVESRKGEGSTFTIRLPINGPGKAKDPLAGTA